MYERLLPFYLTAAQIHTKSVPPRDLVRLTTPTVFSFIENPDETIRHLNSLVAAQVEGAREINIDQRAVRVVDLCALATFNVLARAVNSSRQRSESRRHRRRLLTLSGTFPSDPALKEVIAAVGVPSTLGIESPVKLKREIRSLGLVEGLGNGFKATKSSMTEEVATRVIEHVDSCLHGFGYELRPDAKADIGILTGELLNNCEDHSGRRAWWLSTYLREPEKRVDGDHADFDGVGDFHLTIFSFGDTMAESLNRLPITAQSREGIDRLVSLHESSGFYRTGKMTQESTLTISALQPNTSRKNTSATDTGHRGQGTVQFMKTLARLGLTNESERPEAVLVSGNTWIRFGLHQIGPGVILGKSAGHVVAFNRQNSLDTPPDPLAYRQMKARFPGTLLSLRFNISKSHLSSVSDHVVPRVQG